jgi:hypothetical protein
MEYAFKVLHQSKYDHRKAIEKLIWKQARSPLENWTDSDRKIFMLGIEKFGKEPNLIRSMVFNFLIF